MLEPKGSSPEVGLCCPLVEQKVLERATRWPLQLGSKKKELEKHMNEIKIHSPHM